MNSIVKCLVELGRRFEAFAHCADVEMVVADACAENEWFTPIGIYRAVDAICEEFLQEEKLQSWLGRYNLDNIASKRVAIIMAGNIPLVGFFDLMCVALCGHEAYVKPSSKDRALMEYVISELKSICPAIPIYKYDPEADYDKVIATGGDQAAAFFHTRYSSTPSLIRGSRHSLAVLSGRESDAEIEALSKDIFSYSGLGCRNVSLVMLPRGCELRLPEAENIGDMYRGSYLSTRALMAMASRPFVDLGYAVAVERCDFSDNISCINYCYYDDLAEVEQWLADNENRLQCVVSECVSHPRCVTFGRAQYPTLSDYADGVDVMEFLIAE